MKSKQRFYRFTITVLILAYLQTLIPIGALAEVNECGYDPANPDLEHARQSFRQINYNCAEQELKDLLAKPDLDLEEKANAHVLLAAVYYTIMRDAQEKENKVIEQFAEAFRAYQDWSGDLDIKSSRFAELMEKAKTMVGEEETKAEEPVPVTPAKEQQIKKKPWYTKWWAIALGVGVVAGVAVAVGGGGSSDGGGGTLPDFPDPPAKDKSGQSPGK